MHSLECSLEVYEVDAVSYLGPKCFSLCLVRMCQYVGVSGRSLLMGRAEFLCQTYPTGYIII